MLYALIANDKPDGKRMEVRPDHLAYLATLGDKLVLAGPFLDADGNMNGSFMVVAAETQAEAESIFARDPFMVRGVFESIEIRPWKIGVNNTKV
ncbi:MAG: YciI family protein [Hyphomicrobiales bacterium]|nr:MAG: YciI family protein [Hyphomicrobiales bacterium]